MANTILSSVSGVSVNMKCVTAVLCVLYCVCAEPHSQETSDVRYSDEEENASKTRPTIIGAQTTGIRKYPYNAAVLSSSGTLLGGGMLYNTRWVLTAGVNVIILPSSELVVRVGSDNAYRGGQCYGVDTVIAHPNYTGGDWDWNVGLVKLKRRVRFNNKVKAVKLAMQTPRNSTRAVVTGWGITSLQAGKSDESNSVVSKNGERLQCLFTDIFDTNTCKKTWAVSINTRTFCGHVKNSGPCISDVGDPLIQNGVAVGMYAGGYLCGEDRYPDFYVDLAQFSEWIHETIEANTERSERRQSKVIYYRG